MYINVLDILNKEMKQICQMVGKKVKLYFYSAFLNKLQSAAH